jgi:hypothetical protein
MDTYLEITLNEYGLSFSSAQIYFDLSWLALGLIALSVVGYKITKRIKKGY